MVGAVVGQKVGDIDGVGSGEGREDAATHTRYMNRDEHEYPGTQRSKLLHVCPGCRYAVHWAYLPDPLPRTAQNCPFAHNRAAHSCPLVCCVGATDGATVVDEQ